jgi:hypothetical protein
MNMIGEWLIALMMEEASTSKTSVNFYQTTRRNNPEDRHLHTRLCENLKSHKSRTVEEQQFGKYIHFET